VLVLLANEFHFGKDAITKFEIFYFGIFHKITEVANQEKVLMKHYIHNT